MMFSISLLAWASGSGRLLASTAWFGICRPAALSSAKAARASMRAFRVARDSMSAGGGRPGRSLKGSRG
jgi:hypothetical protein